MRNCCLYQDCHGYTRSLCAAHYVWIGTGAMILPGVVVGSGAIIAARAVVVENEDPHCMVGGVPARIIKQLPSRPERFQNGTQLQQAKEEYR